MRDVAVRSFAIPRLARRTRVVLLTVHVVMSVGWLGLDGGLVALEVTGLSTVNPAVRAGMATAMAVIASWVLMPVVFLALVSGLVLALSTPWGLVRHWWVIAKCVISIVLAATALLLMLPRLPQIIAGDGDPVRMQMLILRSGALLLLLAATAISVVKPWGKTPCGRRLQRAGRRPEKRSRKIPQQRPGERPRKQHRPPVQQK